jgi:hypothetical protein
MNHEIQLDLNQASFDKLKMPLRATRKSARSGMLSLSKHVYA